MQVFTLALVALAALDEKLVLLDGHLEVLRQEAGDGKRYADEIAGVTLRPPAIAGADTLECQALLDELLPMISVELHDHVRDRVMQAADDPIARERARITAFFEFLSDTPHLFAMLHEGEFHSRAGFNQHVEMQTASYERAMLYEMRRGNLKVTDPDKLHVVIRIVMSARDYLSSHYCLRDGQIVAPPPHVIDAYMDFVTAGLFQQPS